MILIFHQVHVPLLDLPVRMDIGVTSRVCGGDEGRRHTYTENIVFTALAG